MPKKGQELKRKDNPPKNNKLKEEGPEKESENDNVSEQGPERVLYGRPQEDKAKLKDEFGKKKDAPPQGWKNTEGFKGLFANQRIIWDAIDFYGALTYEIWQELKFPDKDKDKDKSKDGCCSCEEIKKIIDKAIKDAIDKNNKENDRKGKSKDKDGKGKGEGKYLPPFTPFQIKDNDNPQEWQTKNYDIYKEAKKLQRSKDKEKNVKLDKDSKEDSEESKSANEKSEPESDKEESQDKPNEPENKSEKSDNSEDEQSTENKEKPESEDSGDKSKLKKSSNKDTRNSKKSGKDKKQK